MAPRWKSPGLLLATVLLSAAAVPVPAVGPAGFERRLLAADRDECNWLTHGRNYSETRYSPSARIHTGNVGELGLAWYVDFDTGRGQEATPLVVDGIIYVSSSWSNVYAIDGRTGRRLWRYDAGVPGETAAKACCDVVHRGVAYWNGRVYVGTLDGRLVALDARSGKVLWSVLTVDPTRHSTITGAPRVVKGKVLIGNGGAEYGVRGYVSAYDAGSGALVWRFYTVPGDPSQPFENAILAEAARTWTGEWWKGGGGGTVWDSMAYDPELDLLYIGVGNGSPWNPKIRSPGGGDNLFLSSIVALRPDTGDYVWHYQTTPGEMWDYTATQHMVLADLMLGDTRRKDEAMAVGDENALERAQQQRFVVHHEHESGRRFRARRAIRSAERTPRRVGTPGGGEDGAHARLFGPGSGTLESARNARSRRPPRAQRALPASAPRARRLGALPGARSLAGTGCRG